MPLNVGEVLNNRYRIVGLLGQGGFGAVYHAWDVNLKGPCAVKENFDTSPAAQKQFAREASLLFNLRHPSLPRVSDHFNIPEQGQYLVMDFIEGEDLQSMMEERGGNPLPEEQVLEWLDQVSDALIYLHTQDPPVIHRDIKPANIKITPQNKAILVDFGIAKVFDPHLKTTAGAQAVTPGYSPPEQYGISTTTDSRSDIYALGATSYTLLTGLVPPASLDIVVGHAPPPIPADEINQQVTIDVSAAIQGAMQPDRDLRTQSVSEFKSDLQPFRAPVEEMVTLTMGADVAGSSVAVSEAITQDAPPLLFGYPMWRVITGGVVLVFVVLSIAWGGLQIFGGGTTGRDATNTAAAREVLLGEPLESDGTPTHTSTSTVTELPVLFSADTESPTSTRTRIPTRTPRPTFTKTATLTRTPRIPTNTPRPVPTNTPVPTKKPPKPTEPPEPTPAPPDASPTPAP